MAKDIEDKSTRDAFPAGTRNPNWGGARAGAGKQGLYGELTKPMKVPASRHAEVKAYLLGENTTGKLKKVIENWKKEIEGKNPELPRWKKVSQLLNELEEAMQQN